MTNRFFRMMSPQGPLYYDLITSGRHRENTGRFVQLDPVKAAQHQFISRVGYRRTLMQALYGHAPTAEGAIVQFQKRGSFTDPATGKTRWLPPEIGRRGEEREISPPPATIQRYRRQGGGIVTEDLGLHYSTTSGMQSHKAWYRRELTEDGKPTLDLVRTYGTGAHHMVVMKELLSENIAPPFEVSGLNIRSVDYETDPGLVTPGGDVLRTADQVGQISYKLLHGMRGQATGYRHDLVEQGLATSELPQTDVMQLRMVIPGQQIFKGVLVGANLPEGIDLNIPSNMGVGNEFAEGMHRGVSATLGIRAMAHEAPYNISYMSIGWQSEEAVMGDLGENQLKRLNQVMGATSTRKGIMNLFQADDPYAQDMGNLGEQAEPSHDAFARVLQSDPYGLTINHPLVQRRAGEARRSRILNLATTGGLQGRGYMSIHDWDLGQDEVRIAGYETGTKLILARNPTESPAAIREVSVVGPAPQGAMAIHPNYWSFYFGGDFDGDTANVIKSSQSPRRAREIKQFQQWYDRQSGSQHPDYGVGILTPGKIDKPEVDYSPGARQKWIATAAESSRVGYVANKITRLAMGGGSDALMASGGGSGMMGRMKYLVETMKQTTDTTKRQIMIDWRQFRSRVGGRDPDAPPDWLKMKGMSNVGLSEMPRSYSGGSISALWNQASDAFVPYSANAKDIGLYGGLVSNVYSSEYYDPNVVRGQDERQRDFLRRQGKAPAMLHNLYFSRMGMVSRNKYLTEEQKGIARKQVKQALSSYVGGEEAHVRSTTGPGFDVYRGLKPEERQPFFRASWHYLQQRNERVQREFEAEGGQGPAPGLSNLQYTLDPAMLASEVATVTHRRPEFFDVESNTFRWGESADKPEYTVPQELVSPELGAYWETRPRHGPGAMRINQPFDVPPGAQQAMGLGMSVGEAEQYQNTLHHRAQKFAQGFGSVAEARAELSSPAYSKDAMDRAFGYVWGSGVSPGIDKDLGLRRVAGFSDAAREKYGYAWRKMFGMHSVLERFPELQSEFGGANVWKNRNIKLGWDPSTYTPSRGALAAAAGVYNIHGPATPATGSTTAPPFGKPYVTTKGTMAAMVPGLPGHVPITAAIPGGSQPGTGTSQAAGPTSTAASGSPGWSAAANAAATASSGSGPPNFPPNWVPPSGPAPGPSGPSGPGGPPGGPPSGPPSGPSGPGSGGRGGGSFWNPGGLGYQFTLRSRLFADWQGTIDRYKKERGGLEQYANMRDPEGKYPLGRLKEGMGRLGEIQEELESDRTGFFQKRGLQREQRKLEPEMKEYFEAHKRHAQLLKEMGEDLRVVVGEMKDASSYMFNRGQGEIRRLEAGGTVVTSKQAAGIMNPYMELSAATTAHRQLLAGQGDYQRQVGRAGAIARGVGLGGARAGGETRRGGGGRGGTWYDKYFGATGQLAWTMFMGRRAWNMTGGTMLNWMGEYAGYQQSLQAAGYETGVEATGAPSDISSFYAGTRTAKQQLGEIVWGDLSTALNLDEGQDPSDVGPGLVEKYGRTAVTALEVGAGLLIGGIAGKTAKSLGQGLLNVGRKIGANLLPAALPTVTPRTLIGAGSALAWAATNLKSGAGPTYWDAYNQGTMSWDDLQAKTGYTPETLATLGAFPPTGESSIGKAAQAGTGASMGVSGMDYLSYQMSDAMPQRDPAQQADAARAFRAATGYSVKDISAGGVGSAELYEMQRRSIVAGQDPSNIMSANVTAAAQAGFGVTGPAAAQLRQWVGTFSTDIEKQQAGTALGLAQQATAGREMTADQMIVQAENVVLSLEAGKSAGSILRDLQHQYGQTAYGYSDIMRAEGVPSYAVTEAGTGFRIGTSQPVRMTKEAAALGRGAQGASFGFAAGDMIQSEWSLDAESREISRSHDIFGFTQRARMLGAEISYTGTRRQLDTEMRGIQRGWSEYNVGFGQESLTRSYAQSQEQLQFQREGATMAFGQQMATRAMQAQQMYASQAFTRQGFNIEEMRRPVQRGWATEDFQYQSNVAGMQFGWQQEDIERSIRMATGRQKAALIRQRERGATMYSMEENRRGSLQGRQDQAWEWEDEDFERKKTHWEEMTRYQNDLFSLQTSHMQQNYGRQIEYFDMQKRHMDENYTAQSGHLTNQLEHLGEIAAKQDEIIAADNTYKDTVLAAKAAALVEDAAYWVKMKENQDERVALSYLLAGATETYKMALVGQGGIIDGAAVLVGHARKLAGYLNMGGPIIPPGGDPFTVLDPSTGETYTYDPKDRSVTTTGPSGPKPKSDIENENLIFDQGSMTTINLMMADGATIAQAVVPTAIFIDGVEKTIDRDGWRRQGKPNERF